MHQCMMGTLYGDTLSDTLLVAVAAVAACDGMTAVGESTAIAVHAALEGVDGAPTGEHEDAVDIDIAAFDGNEVGDGEDVIDAVVTAVTADGTADDTADGTGDVANAVTGGTCTGADTDVEVVAVDEEMSAKEGREGRGMGGQAGGRVNCPVLVSEFHQNTRDWDRCHTR